MQARDGAFICCGVRIDALDLRSAADRICGFAGHRRGRAIHLCNAYTLATATRDRRYAALLNRGDLNLADGTPVAFVGRRAGFQRMRRRVYGPDLLLAVADQGRSEGLRHYLYGSTATVVSRLHDRLEAQFPGIRIVGAEDPPFRLLSTAEETALIDRVHSSGADVVWVGLGTPLQDRFVDAFRDRIDATLVAVGAAFDFISGTKPQAPRWMRDHGLEWLFRLASEPRRLWRRYLVGNLIFLAGLTRGVHVTNPPPP